MRKEEVKIVFTSKIIKHDTKVLDTTWSCDDCVMVDAVTGEVKVIKL